MLPRVLTEAEWCSLYVDFPALDRATCFVTGEADPNYNCIAFVLGWTDRWINPASPLSAFVAQFAGYGHPVVAPGAATIDGWGIGDDGQPMTHASRVPADPRFSAVGLWESKIGKNVRVTHERGGLFSARYGSILTDFSQKRDESADVDRPRLPDMQPALTEKERELLNERAIARVLAEPGGNTLINDFATRRAGFLDATTRSRQSDTAAFSRLPEFADLVGMGPRIVPLIFAQLDEESGFFLLDVLEELRPGTTAIEYDTLTGLQSLARLVARAWLAGHASTEGE